MYYEAVDNSSGLILQITDFSESNLDSYEKNGYTFQVVEDDGSVHPVKRSEIVEPVVPEIAEGPLPVITYQLWREAMEPLRDLMAQSVRPAVALMPMTIQSNINDKYGAFISALDKIDETFQKYGF